MTFPWVSRERLDVAEREIEAMRELFGAERARYDALLAVADQRYALLLDKYHELALPPVPSSPVIATTVREPRKPDVVAQAIRDEAAGDTRLAAHLRKRASELKAEGKNAEEIAEQLRSWQTTEHDGRD